MLLAAAGGGLLGYAGGQYWYMYHSQHQLRAQWEQQAMHADDDNMLAAFSDRAPDVRSGSPGAQDVLGRLSIPKIHLDAIVIEGTSSHDLSVGPGHVTKTAMPGETGNAVITAHRDTYFRHLPELDQGDEITIQRDGRLFRYRVTGKKIVKPEDISVLNPTGDAELTLITCYPVYYVGPAPERLVVFSRLAP
jgi:sortase A